jgi:NAD(P)H-hydrate epimerase
MDVLSAAQIKELDRRAVEEGVPEATLMETAGGAVAEMIQRRYTVHRVVVVAGKGGNGGDALVAARRLHEAGIEVRAFTLTPLNALSPLTRERAELLSEEAPAALSVLSDELAGFREELSRADCVIDGLLGIGVDRPLKGRYAEVVRAINQAEALQVAVDLPSGLPSDHGVPLGEAIHADLTVCMAAYKPAHLLYPAREFCGEIEVVPVGYPPRVKESVRPLAHAVERDWVRTHLPVRAPDGHKGTFGRVLIIAGSTGMSGAAILCAKGTLRAGAGLVTLAAPSVLNPILEVALPEVITLPLPDENGHLAGKAIEEIGPALNRTDIVAIGPGLSRDPAVGGFVREILSRVTVPLVIDADGLFPLASHLDLLNSLAGRVILTPHPGELARLIGRSSEEIDRDRIEVVRTFASEHGVVLLLKGRPTAIGTPEGAVYLNPTGNTGLATGGSGDVLTGIIAGLLAGGASLADAAILGAFIHGHTADYLSRDRAERSLIPSDLIDALPLALAEVEN